MKGLSHVVLCYRHCGNALLFPCGHPDFGSAQNDEFKGSFHTVARLRVHAFIKFYLDFRRVCMAMAINRGVSLASFLAARSGV